jgi:replicative DNA helicase
VNHEETKSHFARPTDERAILSLCIRNINNFYSLCSKVSDGDFLCYDNYIIFLILNNLMSRGVELFDIPMVANTADQDGVLSTIGGYEYLESVRNMQVSEDNFDMYISNVIEASTKYKLYNSLQESLYKVESNAKDGISSSDLIGDVEKKALDLSTETMSIKEPINVADNLRELIEERRTASVDMMGLSTGYPILNKQIDGLVPGTVFIVAARPKQGKSTVLSNIAAHVAFRERTPVLYIDTEMTYDQWRDRLIAGMSGVKERDVKHGGYDNEQYDKIVNKCVDIVEGGKLFHEFMPGYTVEKIISLYKKYKYKHNIGLMVFDYLKEPESSSIDRNRKEYQVLGDVTTAIKDLAGKLDIPAITAVQINRNKEVADSDRIVRYGDIVAHWMTRTEEELKTARGTHKLIIRETRRGGGTDDTGIGYYFFKEYLRIKEVEPENQLNTRYEYDDVLNVDDASADLEEYENSKL